jgi:hypothetical protein
MLAGGCTEAHAIEGDAGVPDTGSFAPDTATSDAPVTTDAPGVLDAPPSGELLATCLSEGRGLTEVATVNNNDSADHGALLRFGLSPEGLIAAAGADGTMKLWTLSAELLETFDGNILTYGPEIPAAPVNDIAFDGASILVGDIRGIVLQLDRGGSLFPIGGTTPEIPIRALAFDPVTRRLAHAQLGDVAPLLVRSEDGTTSELLSELVISDLAFDAAGNLLVAGERGGHPVIEERAPGALDAPTDLVTTEVAGSFLEIATISTPSTWRLVAVATEHVRLLSGEMVSFEGGRSIALATDASHAVAFVAGSQGLVALDAVNHPGGSELFRSAVGDAVTVRVDASGTLVVVGTTDAHLHVFACSE